MQAKMNAQVSTPPDDGEHGERTFSALAIPASCPQVMLRRGVSPDKYTADMDAIEELRREAEKNQWCVMLVICIIAMLTFGLGIFLIACFHSEVLFESRCKRKMDEMNSYYNQFGISWSVEFIVQVGSFITYTF